MFLRLFAPCIPVKGAARSLIMDLDRGDFRFIPNDLFDFIATTMQREMSDVEKEANSEFIEFLLEHDYAHYVDSSDQDCFPDMSLVYDIPNIIDNAVINYDIQAPSFKISNVLLQLSELGCRSVEIRVFNLSDYTTVVNILDLTLNTQIESISLCVDSSITEDQVLDLQKYSLKNPRLRYLHIFGTKESKSWYDEDFYLEVSYHKLNFQPDVHCGAISPFHFRISQEFFLLSKNFNSCLYKKVGISLDGSIKNCTASLKSYGNINSMTIAQCLEDGELQEDWNIVKDQVQVCSVCEFRLMCSDCRTYTANEEKYGKPEKCSYDPYKMSWT